MSSGASFGGAYSRCRARSSFRCVLTRTSSHGLRRKVRGTRRESTRFSVRSATRPPPNPSLETDPPRQGALPGSRAAAILRLPGKAPCLCGPLSSNVRRRKPEVLHGRRNYAPGSRPGLPTGQASSRVRIAPASIGLWSSDAWKNQNRSRVLASAHQVRARWPVARTGGT
jgi:hypothetical protein